MLGGRISNNDEDEVEDELERLAQEVSGNATKLPAQQPQQPAQRLPTAPSGDLVAPESGVHSETEPALHQRTAMLAE